MDREAGATSVDSIFDWGMNRTIGEYFHPDTLAEIVAARSWFLKTRVDPTTSLLWAATAHILHGNSPTRSAGGHIRLRRSLQRGHFEPRQMRSRLTDKVGRLMSAHFEPHWCDGVATNRDVTLLDHRDGLADVILTSPPFFGSTRFHVNNWLRLWFCGWEPDRFDRERERFLEYRQARNFSVYEQVLSSLHGALRSGGLAVWHLGKNKKFDMAGELARLGQPWFSFEGCFDGTRDSMSEPWGFRTRHDTHASVSAPPCALGY